jgi:general stress protein YciG
MLGAAYGDERSHRRASVDAAIRRENTRRAGQIAHAEGRAHEFTSAEARAAGRKGGTALSRNRAHLAEIGRKGGCVAGNPSPANPLGEFLSLRPIRGHSIKLSP